MHTYTHNEHQLLPIVKADVLLKSPQYQKRIQEIYELVNLDEKYFSLLYKPLIDSFVEFVQLLPIVTLKPQDTSDKTILNNLSLCQNPQATQPDFNYNTLLGSFMNQSLTRALLALQMLHAKNEILDPLVTYTLFSAALLFDINLITTNRTIIISKPDGDFIQEWIPYKGTMPFNAYYRICYNTAAENPTKNILLLAKQLMPTVGFNWIAQDQHIYDIWIKLLKQKPNNLKIYIDKANEQLEKMTQQLFPVPTNIKATTTTKNALAEDFINWLQELIKNKKISINDYDSEIHVVEDGVFLELPNLLKKFCKEFSISKQWQEILALLKNIGFIGSNEIQGELAAYTYTTSFIQQISLTNTTLNESNPDASKHPTKNHTQYGAKISLPYFLYKLFPNYQVLDIENNFVPLEVAQETNEQKAHLIRKLRMRQYRLLQLEKEIEEMLQKQQQLNLGK